MKNVYGRKGAIKKTMTITQKSVSACISNRMELKIGTIIFDLYRETSSS